MEPEAQNAEEVQMDAETQLTPEALARVLQHVEPQQRLGACARVSKAWNAAAVAATKHVELLGCTQRSCSSLEAWLGAHAAAVDSITVSARFDGKVLPADAWFSNSEGAWYMPKLQLPLHSLTGLTKLTLKLIKSPLGGVSSPTTAAAGAKAAAGVAAAAAAAAFGGAADLPHSSFSSSSSSSHDGSSNNNPVRSSSSRRPLGASLAALTSLRELCVTDCVMQLSGLSELTSLECLELQQGWGAPHSPTPSSSVAPSFLAAAEAAAGASSWEAEAAALSRLTRLEHLTLAGACCSAGALLAVQHLQQLQELVLGWAEVPQPIIAGSEAWCLTENLDDTTLPGLSKLPRLRKLVVSGAAEAFDPVLLQHLPADLAHLQLDDVRLVMTLGRPRLAALSGFSQLTHLSINNRRGPLSFLTPEDCAVLTTSSKLQYVGLSGCQLPADGCSRMLRAEWQLPVFKQLTASPSLLSDPAAVALLGICCPKLQGLVISLPSNSTQRPVGPVDLSGLQQVLGLTQMVLTGVTIAGSPGFRALGQLSGLKELVVGCVRGFRLADVMQLTPLRELRSLKLVHMQLTEVLAASLSLTHQGSEDTPANVWLQLSPALLKQALWLYPFRSLPTPEDLTQVSGLVNALQMHFLAEPCPSAPLGALQQQSVSLALALLQLQQQRVMLAAAVGGGAAVAAAGNPVLQQLQQQTHGLREQLIKKIAEALECIKILGRGGDDPGKHGPVLDPQQQQQQLGAQLAGSSSGRLNPTSLTGPVATSVNLDNSLPLAAGGASLAPAASGTAGLSPAATGLNPACVGLSPATLGLNPGTLGLGGVASALSSQQQHLLLLMMQNRVLAGVGASHGLTGDAQLLQQQLQQGGLQASQLGLVGTGGLLAGDMADAGVAGLLQQQEALNPLRVVPSAGFSGMTTGLGATTDPLTPALLLPQLQQQQQQLLVLAGQQQKQQGLSPLAAANGMQQAFLPADSSSNGSSGSARAGDVLSLLQQQQQLQALSAATQAVSVPPSAAVGGGAGALNSQRGMSAAQAQQTQGQVKAQAHSFARVGGYAAATGPHTHPSLCPRNNSNSRCNSPRGPTRYQHQQKQHQQQGYRPGHAQQQQRRQRQQQQQQRQQLQAQAAANTFAQLFAAQQQQQQMNMGALCPPLVLGMQPPGGLTAAQPSLGFIPPLPPATAAAQQQLQHQVQLQQLLQGQAASAQTPQQQLLQLQALAHLQGGMSGLML